ncbi:MAG: hypothetical protein JJLCMIEE_03141 [Acidimicrobiales bacterium]|nr:hypothetical protein [Acidimicrobiales bacterium]
MTEVPTTSKGRRTRTLILSAARDVLAERGYVALRMTDVAARADLSLGGLYRYFPNKDALFGELVEELSTEIGAAASAHGTDFSKDPYTAMYLSTRGFLEYYRDHRDLMDAWFEAVTTDERYRQQWWATRQATARTLAGLVEQCHGINEVDGVSGELVTEAVISLVEQSAYVWYAKESMRSETVCPEEGARLLARILYLTYFSDATIDLRADGGINPPGGVPWAARGASRR